MFNKKNSLKIGRYAHKFGQGGPLSEGSDKNELEKEKEGKEAKIPKFDFDKFQVFDSGDISTDCGGF